MIRSFLIALQFLTVFPVHLKNIPDEKDISRSLIYYPLVGLLIGSVLTVLTFLLKDASAFLSAALVLTLWVFITGGLHLDGLSDSSDAWVGGLGDREKTLAIMKDPSCGPAGVLSIVLVLLIKYSAIHALMVNENLAIMLLAPTLGRTVIPLLFLTTPYVRRQGLGSALTTYLPHRSLGIVITVTLCMLLLLFGSDSLWLILTAALVFTILRAMMIRRIGGATGDLAGAVVELVESSILVSANLFH